MENLPLRQLVPYLTSRDIIQLGYVSLQLGRQVSQVLWAHHIFCGNLDPRMRLTHWLSYINPPLVEWREVYEQECVLDSRVAAEVSKDCGRTIWTDSLPLLANSEVKSHISRILTYICSRLENISYTQGMNHVIGVIFHTVLEVRWCDNFSENDIRRCGAETCGLFLKLCESHKLEHLYGDNWDFIKCAIQCLLWEKNLSGAMQQLPFDVLVHQWWLSFFTYLPNKRKNNYPLSQKVLDTFMISAWAGLYAKSFALIDAFKTVDDLANRDLDDILENIDMCKMLKASAAIPTDQAHMEQVILRHLSLSICSTFIKYQHHYLKGTIIIKDSRYVLYEIAPRCELLFHTPPTSDAVPKTVQGRNALPAHLAKDSHTLRKVQSLLLQESLVVVTEVDHAVQWRVCKVHELSNKMSIPTHIALPAPACDLALALITHAYKHEILPALHQFNRKYAKDYDQARRVLQNKKISNMAQVVNQQGISNDYIKNSRRKLKFIIDGQKEILAGLNDCIISQFAQNIYPTAYWAQRYID